MSGGNLRLMIKAPGAIPGTEITIYNRKLKTKSSFRSVDRTGAGERYMYRDLAEGLEAEGARILASMIEWAKKKAEG